VSIYLAAASLRALRAAAALAPRHKPSGFLLGHVRGGQYFVEDVLAAPAGDWAAPTTYEKMDDIEPGRVIGFFIFTRSKAERRKIGAPHACGKVVLSAAIDKSGVIAFQGFRIDFEGRFVFESLPVTEEKETAP
jgi:hypothetical protein